MDKSETVVVRIVVDSAPAKAGGKEVENALNSIDAKASAVSASMKKMESALASVATMAKAFFAVWAVQQITQFINAIEKSVSGLGELAEQLGVNTNLLQAYQHAAGQAGVKAEALETAIGRFTKTTGEAVNGNKEAIETFNRLGVKILDANKNVRDQATLMSEAAAAILRLKSGAEQAAAATELFGRGGQKMLTLFAEMAKGPEAMIAAAKQAGVVIDESIIKKLDDMADRADAAERKLTAMIAPLYADVKLTVLENIISLINGITTSAPAAAAQLARILALAGSVGGAMALAMQGASAAAGGGTDPVGALQGTIAGAQGRINSLQGQLAGAERDAAQGRMGAGQRLERLKQQLEEQNKIVADSNEKLRKLVADRVQQEEILAGNDPAGSGRSPPSTGASNPKPKGEGAGDRAAKEYERAKKALDDYIGGLRNEATASAQSDRERAAMLAGLKAEELARAKPLKLTEDQVDAYKREAEELARLNYDRDQQNKQAEQEAKRHAELMQEPFKNAIRGVQSAFTDFFEQLFSGGISSFKDLANAFKSIFVRMFAELASMQLMRSLGLTQILGGGTGAGSVAIPQGGGFNIGSIAQLFNSGGGSAGGGGIGGLFSGASSWLSGLFGGGGAASGAVGVANTWAPVSASTWMAGTAGTGAAVGGGGTALAGAASAIPVWGWIAAAAMMAKNMVGPMSNGGVRGAISTLLGPSLEEWQANPAQSAWTVLNPLGPVGAVIGNLLGFSPFGGKKPKTPQATQDIVVDPATGLMVLGGTTTRGAGNIPGVEKGGTFVTDAINRLMHSAGLQFTAGAEGGYLLNSQGKNTGDQWIIGSGAYSDSTPGGKTPVEIADGISDGAEAASQLIGEIIRRAAADGHVIETGRLAVSETMRTVLAAAGEVDADEIQARIDFARQYDEFLRGDGAAAEIENTILGIREAVNAMVYEAERLGVAVAPLDVEMNRRIQQIGTDFLTGIADQVMQMEDPSAYQRLLNQRNYDTGLESLNALLAEGAINADQFASGLSNLNKLLELVNKTANDNQIGGAFQNIEGLMRNLTYGPLSLASPTQTLSGLSATYAATAAQAMAGDAGAIARYAGLAAEYVDFTNRYYGGDGRAADIRGQVFADSASIYAAQGDPQAEMNATLQQMLGVLIETFNKHVEGQATSGQVIEVLEDIRDGIASNTLAPSNTTAPQQEAA